MVPLALLLWILACSAVFYGTLASGADWARRAETRAGERLEALWFRTFSARRLLYGTAGAAAVLGVLVGAAVHPLAGALASILLLAVPPFTLGLLASRRRAAFESQLPDVLDSLVGSLKSGFGLEQGLRLAADQVADPMRQELGLVLREVGVGSTLEVALAALAARMPGEDLRLFVAAVALARETGGSLAEVFGELAATVRSRRQVEGRMRSLTAQGRLQGVVVGALPVALGTAMYLIQPEMMRRFLNSPTGWALMALGAGLELVGVLWIRRILRVDV